MEKDESSNGKGWPDFLREGNRVENDKEEKEQQEACFLWTGLWRSVTEVDLRQGTDTGRADQRAHVDQKLRCLPLNAWKSLSRVRLFATPWNFPGQNTGVGSLFLLQGIFPTQGSNPGLPHCRWILYQLGHKGSPRILEWVAYPSSSRSSWPRNQTGVSCIEWPRVLTRKTS